MERASLAAVSAAHAGRADLHGHDLRPRRGVLRSIILPEHAGIISDAVRARAGVLPSELLQLYFGALLKMDTVFADRWASGPSVARRATGPAWARWSLHEGRCSAPRQRVWGLMEHGCGQALSVHLHEVKEWSASGQPCRDLQGSGWGQPVGSMHRCTELLCGPQAPESTRSCDK